MRQLSVGKYFYGYMDDICLKRNRVTNIKYIFVLDAIGISHDGRCDILAHTKARKRILRDGIFSLYV